ncbi:ABC transporter substrate-binding protein [Kineococcus sp. SYSU DK003]|uniref:ABC transporter substrate-binding protein n=1 Tax=Kineococcus sp. SYSU DK003 TaxID=3383124 RepID=UPI003D7F0F71
MQRRHFLTAAAAAGALTACSSGAGSGTDDSGAVTLWGSWSGDQVAQLKQLLQTYNDAHPGTTVTYKQQEVVEEKLLTAIAGGQVPDVVLWDRFTTNVYAPKGALEPIDDRLGDVDLNAFYPEAVEELRVDDQLYGLPLLVDCRALFYNKAFFAEAGLNPPTTWQELADTASALTVRTGGKLERAGFSLDDPGLFSTWLGQAGGTMLTEDGTATNFNSPEGLQVLTFWDELLRERKVYDLGFGDGGDAFGAGQLAMKYDGPWSLTTYDAVEGLEYAVVPPVAGPDGGRAAGLGGFGLVIPKGARNPDAAWDFITWWTTQPANGVEFGKVTGWIPANQEAAQDPYFTGSEKYAGMVETLGFAKARPTVKGYSDVEGKALIPALEKFLAGEVGAEEALDTAARDGDRVLQEAAK